MTLARRRTSARKRYASGSLSVVQDSDHGGNLVLWGGFASPVFLHVVADVATVQGAISPDDLHMNLFGFGKVWSW